MPLQDQRLFFGDPLHDRFGEVRNRLNRLQADRGINSPKTLLDRAARGTGFEVLLQLAPR